MLGFVLSKINLLILVVAVFAIVSFFTVSLIDLVKVYQGRLVLEQLSSKAYSLVSSPAYCFSDSFDLPRSIEVGGSEFFFVVKISTQPVNTFVGGEEKPETVVIFSMFPRREYVKFEKERDLNPNAKSPPAVAAASFRTASEVKLFSRDYSGDNYQEGNTTTESSAIFADPNTTIPFETIEFRKEIINGKEKVYIFPCSSTRGNNCGQVKCEVACDAFSGNSGILTCSDIFCNADNLTVDFKC